MKKMGLPEHVIKHKMVSDGFKDQVDVLFDVCILGKDPPKPEPKGIISVQLIFFSFFSIFEYQIYVFFNCRIKHFFRTKH